MHARQKLTYLQTVRPSWECKCKWLRDRDEARILTKQLQRHPHWPKDATCVSLNKSIRIKLNPINESLVNTIIRTTTHWDSESLRQIQETKPIEI